MNTRRTPLLIVCLGLAVSLLSVLPGSAWAGSFVAFSLRAAEARLQAARSGADEVRNLGRMTRLAGMVYDPASSDVILVGQLDPQAPAVTLDDVAVALRALAVHKTWPLVSIDKTETTEQTGTQTVRFAGGIEHTAFGRDLLESDLILKKLALGRVSSPGVSSYFQRSVTQARTQGLEELIGTRFWFYPHETSSIAERDGVFAIRDLRIGVEAQVMYARKNGAAVANVSQLRDAIGEDFAADLTAQVTNLAQEYPVLRRLKTLFDLVSLVEGIISLPTRPDLDYWLQRYPVSRVETPSAYPLLRQREEIHSGKTARTLEINGGIELKALLLRLKAGDVTALREAVLASRPTPAALTWPVPLNGWRIPGTPETPADRGNATHTKTALRDRIGSFITRHLQPHSATRLPASSSSISSPLSFASPAWPRMTASVPRRSALPWQGSGIGGVMLSNTAKVEGLTGVEGASAAIDPTTGSFDLVVQGHNVRISNMDLRKFVTVLWAVYFGEEDPGISIDPIGPDADQQLVRFIGNTVGNTLGKTLLDADYFMKRAAIGAVRPAVLGFQSVDELIGRHGINYLGAGRRFWFVPQDMRFRRAGNALLFESGRMTLQTEKLMRNANGKTDASDRAFAQFWTEHFWEFAAVNPVFEELFAYARMTALAKYLKHSGLNLQWFLLANRHLVLHDDVPGSVPALRAPSQVLRGVQWVGGVDLGTDMSDKRPGRYVIDATAATALRKVQARRSTPSGRKATDRSASSVEPDAVTVKLPDQTYTIVPAESLSSGKGRDGVTFHTDMALRANGEPGIELVRYNAPGWHPGRFGAGWQLYLPYRIRPVGTEQVKATEVAVQQADESTVRLDILVPKYMVVVDVITGDQETLVFDTTRFNVAAWVPEKATTSRFTGMAYLTDGSCLLFEKSGARFGFDGAMRPTDILFSSTHGMHFAYAGERIVRITDTFGGQVEVTYDKAGNVTQAASASATVKYRYLDDELVSVRHSTGRRVSLIYRRDGSLDEVMVKKAKTKGY